MRFLTASLVLSAFLLGGCQKDEPDVEDDNEPKEKPSDDWGYELDPDTDSYIPKGYGVTDPARVMFLGDSITAGHGARYTSGTYVRLLLENDNDLWEGWNDYDLETKYGRMDYIDVSVGGATSDTLVGGQLPDLESQVGNSVDGESMVVITIGGNDMQNALYQLIIATTDSARDRIADDMVDNVIANMDETIDFFEDDKRFPDGVAMYFANVYEPSDRVGQHRSCFGGLDYSHLLKYFEQANDAVRANAEERQVAMVDMAGHFKGHGMNHDNENSLAYDDDDPSLWFANDCIHPNDRGHHELRRLFFTAIEGRPLEAQGEVP